MIQRCQTLPHRLCVLQVALVICAVGCRAESLSESRPASVPATGIDTSRSSTRQTSESAIQFRDQLTHGEIPSAYSNGQEAGFAAILESMGGGAAVLDYDLDARDDLCFAGGGRLSRKQQIEGLTTRLYRNQSHWDFADVTSSSNLEFDGHYSHGVIAADYDSDGFPDLLITGYGGLTLWRNQGDGTFQDVTAVSELTDSLWSCSAGWGDLNGDGILDLYVAHYVNWSFQNHPRCSVPNQIDPEVCPPRSFDGLPDVLYLGNGDGSFRDASQASRLRSDGKGLGVLICDLDSDGDLDIYVANDTVQNFLYENQGTGIFEEVSVTSAAAFNDRGNPDGSMGIEILDYNQDGQFDIWVTNYETEDCALYENCRQMIFNHVSQQTGLARIGGVHVSWGTCCFDMDCDGDEDIFVTNGHVSRFPLNSQIRQRPFLCENLQGKQFISAKSPTSEYLQAHHMGRGAAMGDFDGDGLMDLVISHIHAPPAVLKNVSDQPGHWLKLELTGVRSPRDAVGTIVRVTTSAGSYVRQWRGGGSYASTNSRQLHFGLGSAETIEEIAIRWPSGHLQSIHQLKADQRLRVIEFNDRIVTVDGVND